MRAALLLLCCSVLPVNAVKWFGYYDDDLTVTHSYSNLHQAGSAKDAVAARALGQSSLLSVRSTFFHSVDGELRLRADYKDAWAAEVPIAQELLHNGTIIGFNLGDELVWNCLPPDQLRTASDAVRASFPRGSGIIWYNEASGPASSGRTGHGCNQSTVDFSIPASLDWFSVDIYHMDGIVQGWVDAYVKRFYDQYIFPHLSKEQSVMLVPGSFGSNVNHYPNGTYVCNQSCYDTMCAHDAGDFYDWAKTDGRVAAIMPWNWGGCAGCNGSRWTPPHTCCMDEIGTKDQPKARAAWAAIGAQIVQQSRSDA
eukprot:TRINITY_DN19209_c0_g1_i1.p1 TRINITY_DN19209_c0_g1~~TRINITY_DN19209_c0_g1_i1.p1  ORF type:complete len:311 (+),score=70.04 TRINITY_DN19209_c0_g1_i1:96-1028(+)